MQYPTFRLFGFSSRGANTNWKEPSHQTHSNSKAPRAKSAVWVSGREGPERYFKTRYLKTSRSLRSRSFHLVRFLDQWSCLVMDSCLHPSEWWTAHIRITHTSQGHNWAALALLHLIHLCDTPSQSSLALAQRRSLGWAHPTCDSQAPRY